MKYKVTNVGRVLRRMIDIERISQTDLADLLQCNTSRLSEIIRGRRKPISAEEAIAIADVFDVSPQELLQASTQDLADTLTSELSQTLTVTI